MSVVHSELAVKFIQLLLLENLQIIINSQVLPNTISFQELYYFLLQKTKSFPHDRTKGNTTLKTWLQKVEKENCMM